MGGTLGAQARPQAIEAHWSVRQATEKFGISICDSRVARSSSPVSLLSLGYNWAPPVWEYGSLHALLCTGAIERQRQVIFKSGAEEWKSTTDIGSTNPYGQRRGSISGFNVDRQSPVVKLLAQAI